MPKSLNLIIKCPPFSINRAYYKNRQRTKECRAWGNEVHRQISQPTLKEKIVNFRTKIKENSIIHVVLTYYYPHDILLTQKKNISKRSMDLSNIEKLLIDLIFDPRFDGRLTTEGEEIQTLNCDDKLITRLVSEKKISPTNEHLISIDVELDDVSNL